MTNVKLASVGLALILSAMAVRGASALPQQTVVIDRHEVRGDVWCVSEAEQTVAVKRPAAKRHKTKQKRDAIPSRYAGKPKAKHAKAETAKGSAPLVVKARAYLGQTAKQVGVRSTLWCSAFLRKITGVKGVDDTARSWLKQPRTKPLAGAIVVLTRKGGGHVGVLVGFDAKGNPRIISGNHGHRVAESVYPKKRVIAYVASG